MRLFLIHANTLLYTFIQNKNIKFQQLQQLLYIYNYTLYFIFKV